MSTAVPRLGIGRWAFPKPEAEFPGRPSARNHVTKRRPDAPIAGPSAGPPAASSPTTGAPLPARSRARTWLLRLLAATLLPALLLLIPEAILRLVGYGHPTSFFVATTIQGRRAWAGNPRFTERFFPPALARELDRPLVYADKPAGSVRIFVIGDSAAQGDPAPPFGFSRILGAMLRQRHPGRSFEVVNTAVTAINSHVMVPIAAECARLSPDCLVLYLGNNEVIGPFGPATVLTPVAPNLALLRASLAVKTTRLGQFLGALMSRGRSGLPREWGGMEMFLGNRIRRDDPRIERVNAHFARNLADIIRSGVGAGARVVVCALGVNLKDCAPFASMHRDGLDAVALARFQSLIRSGADAEATSQPERALDAYGQALLIDDTFAEVHYRIGRCLAGIGRDADALAAYSLARDLDALPFRATSRLIAKMRDAAVSDGTGMVQFADVARAFEADSPQGIPGDRIFYEHVHMRFHGNYIAARTVLAQVERSLDPPACEIPTESECADLLGFGDWELLRISRELLARMSSPPFTDQSDHAAMISALEAEIARLGPCEEPPRLAAVEPVYRRALALDPDDWRLREVFGRFLLEGRKDAAGALEQFQAVLAAVPFDHHAQANLALALREAKRLDEAAAAYQAALVLKPDYCEALCGLGLTRARQGRLDEAQPLVARALERQPGNTSAHAAFAQILEQRGLDAAAFDHYAKAGESPERLAVVRNRFAAKHIAAQRIDDAIREWRESIALCPDNREALFNLGVALAQRGDVDPALTCFREVARLDPAFAPAHAQLGSILLGRDQAGLAIPEFETAVRLDPTLAAAQNSLGVALAAEGRVDEAITHFAEAVRLRPDLADARANFARAQALLRSRR